MPQLTDNDVKFFSSGCTLFDLALGGGWALPRIFNIVGDKSVGKCVRNAYILDESGVQLIDKIGELFPSGITPWQQNLGATINQSVQCSHFYKEEVNQTLKVTTRHGYELEGTSAHPILCWTQDCRFEFKKLEEIKIGDYAIIAKNADLIQRNPPSLCSLPEKGPYDSYCAVPSVVTEDLAKFLGLFVADGNFVGGASLTFSNDASWFRTVLLTSSENSFGVTPIETLDEKNNTNQFNISRTRLNQWLNCIFENKRTNFTGRTKFIPKIILESPKEIQKFFLRSLIDCDSWFDQQGNTIQYSTASEQLALQVQLLLLNFGVITTRSFDDNVKGYEGHRYWDITISGERLIRYIEEIGTNREEVFNPTGLAKSQYDSIPFIKQRIINDIAHARTQVDWKKNGKTNRGRFPTFQINTDMISFRFFQQSFINTFKNSKFSEFFDWTFYESIRDSNFHFDPVINIEELNHYKLVQVHDVHVPTSHRFWCNGFISHNTLQAIEAFANFKITFGPKARMRYAEAESAFDETYADILGFPDEVERIEGEINTVTDFEKDFYKFMRASKDPGLYILDSLDAICSEVELENVEKRLEGVKEKGSFGAEKAKDLSAMFRHIAREMATHNTCLGIISQVRENIGVMFGDTKTRSGGKALDFYASQVVYLAQTGKIEREVMKVKRATGVHVECQVKKNKVGFPFRRAAWPLIFSYGVDDEISMIDWLKTVGQLTADSYKIYKANIEKLREQRNYSELTTLRNQLKADVTKLWNEIESKLSPPIRKYDNWMEQDESNLTTAPMPTTPPSPLKQIAEEAKAAIDNAVALVEEKKQALAIPSPPPNGLKIKGPGELA